MKRLLLILLSCMVIFNSCKEEEIDPVRPIEEQPSEPGNISPPIIIPPIPRGIIVDIDKESTVFIGNENIAKVLPNSDSYSLVLDENNYYHLTKTSDEVLNDVIHLPMFEIDSIQIVQGKVVLEEGDRSPVLSKNIGLGVKGQYASFYDEYSDKNNINEMSLYYYGGSFICNYPIDKPINSAYVYQKINTEYNGDNNFVLNVDSASVVIGSDEIMNISCYKYFKTQGNGGTFNITDYSCIYDSELEIKLNPNGNFDLNIIRYDCNNNKR